ncbi:MAG: SRPBCC family protein [Acidimicrobiales bacterium]
MATVRRHVRINRPAADVWAILGDATALPSWFPGIVDAKVDGVIRVVTTGTGLPMPEEIITCDPLLRRFQYRITAPMFRHHLSTIDVIDLDDGTTLAIYGVDAEPSVLALTIGGAAGAGLESLKTMLEQGEGQRGS